MGTILKALDIHKYFGGVKALQGVSLEIEENEILGIIGPNGSGKTTLINVISGFLKVDRGKIIYQGKDITNLPPYKRARLGMVRTFQIPRPLSNITVMENIIIGTMIAGVENKEVREHASRILEQVGLGSSAYKKAGLLNMIEKKRLELARVIALNPKLVMLDEVLAGAHGFELTSLLETIKGLKRNGVTVVIVEHLVAAVSSICDRLVVLDAGRKIAEGYPREVLENVEVVKAYIGEG
jgi:branched-chain amino acid transport system ATP-binding protein